MDTHIFSTAIGQFDFNITATHYGLFQLRSLVAFGRVGVKIILSFEGGLFANFRINCQTKHHCIVHGLFVEYRQCAGHGQINGTGLSISFGTE